MSKEIVRTTDMLQIHFESGGSKFFKAVILTIYQTLWYHIPEDHNLNIHHHENLRSHNLNLIVNVK
jgi:hypothetical protein